MMMVVCIQSSKKVFRGKLDGEEKGAENSLSFFDKSENSLLNNKMQKTYFFFISNKEFYRKSKTQKTFQSIKHKTYFRRLSYKYFKKAQPQE